MISLSKFYFFKIKVFRLGFLYNIIGPLCTVKNMFRRRLFPAHHWDRIVSYLLFTLFHFKKGKKTVSECHTASDVGCQLHDNKDKSALHIVRGNLLPLSAKCQVSYSGSNLSSTRPSLSSHNKTSCWIE